MAVRHGRLGVVYHTLKRDAAFANLGVSYFERHDTDPMGRQLITKLKRLGCKVTIAAAAA